MDLNDLQLEMDGVTRSFAEWTSDFVASYYPYVGQECYRVPALHFNRQTFSQLISPAGGVESQLVLQPLDPSDASGDLAHTIVLERLEELSHDLKARGQGPLFIISSVNYDNYLAKLQIPRRPKAKRHKQCAKSTTQPIHPKAGFQHSSQPTPKTATTEETQTVGKDLKEGGGKQLQLPPRPRDRGGQRGEIDILLLHRYGGVFLIEVKAVGHTFTSWTPSEEELRQILQQRVQRAEKQLGKGRDTLHYIMPDVTLPQVTLVLALPFVTRQQLEKAASSLSFDPNLRFLCKDDLSPLISEDPLSPTQAEENPLSPTQTEEDSLSPTQTEEGNVPSSPQDVKLSPLLTWWKNTVCRDDSKELSVDSMNTIVGRICGLMSVVSVWTTSRPRVEVRTLSQAIEESGHRLADIVLLPRQAQLLAQPSLHHLWLTGPMGSGKTLLLQLKGRQWKKEGRRVIVINVRTASRGRPQGYVLERSICQEMECSSLAGSVERHDIALDDLCFDKFHQKLVGGGPMENACFVIDEVLCEMYTIAQKLAEHYPHCPIWCVATYVTPVPDSFQCFKLGAVLRNPPSVQLMLKELDLNSNHKSAYTTRSAAQGLACDGPPVIFIEHSKHSTGVRNLDCEQCAHELADILEHKLGLKLRPQTAEPQKVFSTETVPSAKSADSQSEKADETVKGPQSQLSFRDVLILVALPLSALRHIRDYHWETYIPEVLPFIMFMGASHFVSALRHRGVPLRFAIDNTQKEIAFPPDDEVIITDVMGAHSLERKVVVLLRSGPSLSQQEVTEHISRYQTFQASANAGHQTTMSSVQELLKPSLDSEVIQKQLNFFSSLMYEVRDIIYPQVTITASPFPEEAKVLFQRLFGNMLVAGSKSFIDKNISNESLHDQESPFPPSARPRRGMEFRGGFPAGSDLPPSQSEETEASGISEMIAQSGDVQEAYSVFFMPDLQEDMLQRQGEVKRIQRAMESMSEDDKDWEFFAASRCLSQYISILF